MKDLTNTLENDEVVLNTIKEELNQIKIQFNDKRKTSIEAANIEVDIEDLIDKHDCVVTLTHFGYIKRQSVDVYKTQKRGGKGVIGLSRREEDFVEELFICSSHDYIIFFTNNGKAYRLKCYEIPEGSRVSKGTNIINLLTFNSDEKITAVIKVSDALTSDYLVMLTRNGIIKRTKLLEYKNIRKAGLIAINLDENDELGWVALTDGNANLFMATKYGKAIYYSEKSVRCVGRNSRGVKAIKMKMEDTVVGMAAISSPKQKIITITENGMGRCTKLSEYRAQGRGGQGVINYKISKKTGLVADVKAVNDDDDIIIITSEGTIIRTPIKDISVISRTTSGVKLMRIDDNERIITLARVKSEQEFLPEICDNST